MAQNITIPLYFWANATNIKSTGYFYNPYLEELQFKKTVNNDKLFDFIKKNKVSLFNLCDCSYDETWDIINNRENILSDEHIKNKYKTVLECLGRINSTEYKYYEQFKDNEYFKDRYFLKEYDDLSNGAKELITWCVDFLLYNQQNELCGISLSAFIYNFLDLKDGYEYVLMNILYNYGITGHGSGIRASWYEKNDIFDDNYTPKEESIRIITEFCKTL